MTRWRADHLNRPAGDVEAGRPTAAPLSSQSGPDKERPRPRDRQDTHFPLVTGVGVDRR